MTIQRTSVLDQPAHYLEGADFQIVVPEESTNLIANPSLETNTTGWTASLATMTRDTARSFFGAAALKLSYGTAGAGSYAYSQVSVSPSTTYTLSAYAFVESATGAAAGDNAMAVVDGATTFAVTGLTKRVGHWRRWTLTFTTGAATTSVYVDLYCPKGVVFWDGVQLEAKPYATTYIDGEQDDCIWMGAQHASASYRPVATRKGGRPMKLSDYKFKVVSVIGAGAAALSTVATPYANIGGGYYQRSIAQSRTLQIAGQFECASHIDLMRNRAALVDAVNPNRTPNPQPARLLYTPLGCASDEPDKQVVIDGVYAGGLEGNQTNEIGVERAVMAFNVYFPFMAVGSGVGDRSVPLAYSDTINTAGDGFNDIAFQNNLSGAWSVMGGGPSTGSVGYVLNGTDNLPYIIGTFGTIGGVSANYVARWNGSTFTPTGSGPGGPPYFYKTAVGPDNALYYVYQISGTTVRLQKWDGSSWTTVADFTHGSSAIVYSIAVGNDGAIYAAGQFTTAGGVAITNIAKYSGGTWAAMGSAPNGKVVDVAIGKDGSIFAGGEFTSIGGVSANRVARWNGSTWGAMGSGVSIAAGTASVNVLYVARDGRLYASGDFDTAGGVAATNVAVWNGSGWSRMGDGIVRFSTVVFFVEDNINGVILVGGFNVVNKSNVKDVARWTGSTWTPGPVRADAGAGNFIFAALPFGVGSIYAGNASEIVVPGVTSVVGATQTNSLKFVFTGPGALVSIKNHTTGDSLFFDLALNAGEIATLTLGQKLIFMSNFRGDISGSLIGASNIAQFRLLPGTNNISVFMVNTTGASAATLTYKEMYQSLDSVVK